MMKKLKIDMTPLNMRKGRYKIVPFILIFLALFSSVGLADWNCLNNTFSQYSTTLTVGSSSVPLSYPKNCTLSGGCNPTTGICYPSPYDISIMDLGILFGVITITIILFVLSFKVEQEGFKIFYFLVGLVFLLAVLLIIINYISIMNKESSLGFIADMLWYILVALVFTVVVIFILILKDLANLIVQKKLLQIRW
jgi:hypothetical protein